MVFFFSIYVPETPPDEATVLAHSPSRLLQVSVKTSGGFPETAVSLSVYANELLRLTRADDAAHSRGKQLPLLQRRDTGSASAVT